MATPYWEHRAALRQAAYDRANNKVVETVSRAYDRTMRQLDKDIDTIMATYTRKTGLSTREAYDFLREGVPQSVMDDLRSRAAVIADPRQRKQLDVMLRTDAYRARISRLDAIKASTRVGLTEAAEAELGAITPHLRHTADLAYSRTMFDIQKTTAGFQMVGVPRRTLDTILKSKWAGDTFSQSVWANRDATYNMMSQAMSEIVGMGKLSSPTLKDLRGMVSIDKWKEQLKSKFKKESQYRKYAANRLIRTESAYVANQTTAIAYDECGIEKYEYMATLDSRTSKKCSDNDGKIIDLADKEVGVNWPPLHPHCRSTTAPVIDGLTREGLTRAARDKDGKSVYVPRDMKYQEWQAWQDAGCPDVDEWRNKKQFNDIKHVKAVERKNVSLDVEVGTILDKDGNVLSVVKGGAHRVEVDEKLLDGNIFTHNHPSGSHFSTRDLRSFTEANLLEMRTTTPEGIYRSIRQGTGKLDTRIAEDYERSGITEMPFVNQKIKEAIENGDLSIEEYSKDKVKARMAIVNKNASEWFRQNSEKYGYIYEEGDLL